ncbi:MAG: TolC family protein [Rhodothermales bacterium]|nr:TolC family protein [Rhodothermales bacterium]
MIALLLALWAIAPADTIRLDTCYRLAEAHHPRRQEFALHDEIAALRLDNLDARFLPTLSLQSQATYQSAIPSFPITLPGASGPTISHDQYRVSLSVDQLVYDGGVVRRQQALERLQRDAAQQEVAVDLYRVRDQVNVAYFGALAAETRLASLQTFAEDLASRHRRLEAQVRAGLVTPGNADVMAVERLRVDQQVAEAESASKTALAVLSELIGQPADGPLAWPEAPDAAFENQRARPEYAAFALQTDLLASQQALAGLKTRPRVVSFAEAAYGRPAGLDLFDDRFQPFYSFGLRVQWGFWDWRVSQRDREALTLQQDVVAAREEVFTRQLDLAAVEHGQAIERLEALLVQDEEIIMLRARITEAAASQLDNGVLTATDFLIERNAEQQARLTRDLHALQLLKSRIDYATALATGE